MRFRRELFDRQRRPRFGNANPERMHVDFWDWMIRGDTPSLPADASADEWIGAVLKSAFGPSRLRDLFDLPGNRDDGPIWTFSRMGRTHTALPDGRVVCIGGEHEDSYDPDFCIYNDVVVFKPSGDFEIYGYPSEVFPPTDFHSATLVNDRIVMIGAFGYANDRRPGNTPVFSLDADSYEISRVETSGDNPGWIHKHEAKLTTPEEISIRGGTLLEELDGRQRLWSSFDDFTLDLSTGVWRRAASRNWTEFKLSRSDHKLLRSVDGISPSALRPRFLDHTLIDGKHSNRARFAVHEVPVSVRADFAEIQIVIEGSLPGDLMLAIADEIRAGVEAELGQECVLTSRPDTGTPSSA